MYITNHKINDITYEKFGRLDIISPEEFEDYEKKLKKEGKKVKVVYNTNLKTPSLKKKDEEHLMINYEMFSLLPEKDVLAEGYIAISETEFIRVEKNMKLPIIIAKLAIMVLVVSCFAILILNFPSLASFIKDRINFNKKDEIIVNQGSENNITVDVGEKDWNGEKPIMSIKEATESIIIPGFHKFSADSFRSDVPLYNPSENTVYLKYTIYNILDSKTDKEFNTYEEANKYVKEQKKEYTFNLDTLKYYDSTTDTYLDSIDNYEIKSQDDRFTVLKENVSIVHCTEAISPGKQVLWDAYKSLGPGEYNLRFHIETYDIETGSACNGARPSVKAIIKK